MLGADRPAVAELLLVRLAVEPDPAQPHPRRPRHVLVDLGDRQAALLAGLRLLRAPEDLRVDQHHRLAAARPCRRSPSRRPASSPRAASPPARSPARRTSSRACPPQARGCSSSTASTRAGGLAQPRVGMDQDRSDRHCREIGEAIGLDKQPSGLRRQRGHSSSCPARPEGSPMFDFDEIIDRRGTHCSKWDMMQPLYGVSPDDGLAMWVADMDFRPPPAVAAAVAAEAAHGVFGYFGDDRAYKAAIRGWMSRRHGWEVDPAAIFTTHGIVAGLAHLPAGLHRARRRRDPLHPGLPRLPPHHRRQRPRDRRSRRSSCREDGRYAHGPRGARRRAHRPRAHARPLLAAQPRRPGLEPRRAPRARRLLPRPRPPPRLRRDPPRPRPPRQPPRADAARRARDRSTGW